MPGTHHVAVNGKDGSVWFSENWSFYLTRLDPRTGEVKQLNTEGTAGLYNFALAPDGSIWSSDQATNIVKVDPKRVELRTRILSRRTELPTTTLFPQTAGFGPEALQP